MVEVQEFVHEFGLARNPRPSYCFVRIIKGEQSVPAIICCMMLYERGEGWASCGSVTNYAEDIAKEVAIKRGFIQESSKSILNEIRKELSSIKRSEIIDYVLDMRKRNSKFSYFVLDLISLYYKFVEKLERDSDPSENLHWIEYYPSRNFREESYDIVTFDRVSWLPEWKRVSVEEIANITDYDSKHFKIERKLLLLENWGIHRQRLEF